jgi:iron complex transport system substrate-binding protein
MKRLLALTFFWLTASAHAQLSVTDDAGRTVTLSAPAQRIVSLAPSVTENLFALGVGARIVGADEFSNYPLDAKKIPRIGRFSALDLERIVALKPDLVIGWASGNPAGQIDKLRALGLTVFLSEPRKISDVASNLRRLAQLTGVSAQGETLASDYERGFAELGQRYAQKTPLTVFYQIWHEPLMTVNREHSINAVLQLCGARNVFDSMATLAPTVSLEAVLRADPQAIVGSGSDGTRPTWLDDWRRWPSLRAVKNQALYDIPPDLMQRPTLRLLEGARRVCAALDDTRQRLKTSP